MTQTRWSRRNALKLAVGSGILAALPRQGAQGAPLGLPVGVQLYPVSDELGKDFDGTLRRVAEIGYTIVELPSFYGRKPVDLRRSLDAAGLKCISGGVFANPMGAGRAEPRNACRTDFRRLPRTRFDACRLHHAAAAATHARRTARLGRGGVRELHRRRLARSRRVSQQGRRRSREGWLAIGLSQSRMGVSAR